MAINNYWTEIKEFLPFYLLNLLGEVFSLLLEKVILKLQKQGGSKEEEEEQIQFFKLYLIC